MRTAVVGHLEWTDFLPVERLPRRGEILETTESFAEPAGGGAVASVQLARLAGDCTFLTAVGDDALATPVEARLAELGVRAVAVRRTAPTRRAFVYLDDGGERTITTIGERIHPRRDDSGLPWEALEHTDVVYFVAGDAEALRAARAARVLVATARIGRLLADAGVQLDAVVGSARDAAEAHRAIEPAPRLVVRTEGADGGSWSVPGGGGGRWSAAELPGPPRDAYGAGDSFAAGLAFGLGDGRDVAGALELAARCGAKCMTGRGPYERQLLRSDL